MAALSPPLSHDNRITNSLSDNYIESFIKSFNSGFFSLNVNKVHIIFYYYLSDIIAVVRN